MYWPSTNCPYNPVVWTRGIQYYLPHGQGLTVNVSSPSLDSPQLTKATSEPPLSGSRLNLLRHQPWPCQEVHETCLTVAKWDSAFENHQSDTTSLMQKNIKDTQMTEQILNKSILSTNNMHQMYWSWVWLLKEEFLPDSISIYKIYRALLLLKL